MSGPTVYRPQHFNLSDLEGISNRTLEMHLKLYEGYVKGVNDLNEQIERILADGTVDQEEVPSYSEIKRRLGFEYSGMVLHEYYFGNLKSGGGSPDKTFISAAESSFGTYAHWKIDFVGVGKMRGVGWAVCYQDPRSKRLSNHWITLHEVGNISGFNPILVMDLWEHAFLLDYAPADRPKYVEAFMANVDWNSVRTRLERGIARPAA